MSVEADVQKIRSYLEAQIGAARAKNYVLHIPKGTLDECIADGIVDWSTGVAVVGGFEVAVDGCKVGAPR